MGTSWLDRLEKDIVDGSARIGDVQSFCGAESSSYNQAIDLREGLQSIEASGPYPALPKRRREGPALVCGFAWNLMDDYAAALKIFGSVPVFAVNRAGGALGGDYLVSKDINHAEGWRAKREAFSEDKFLYIAPRRWRGVRSDWPAVDHWWPAANSGGTTAWCAVRIARFLGHSPIVLCGVPLEPGPYLTGDQGDTWTPAKLESHTHSVRSAILADQHLHKFVRSMSGWTQETFGAA